MSEDWNLVSLYPNITFISVLPIKYLCIHIYFFLWGIHIYRFVAATREDQEFVVVAGELIQFVSTAECNWKSTYFWHQDQGCSQIKETIRICPQIPPCSVLANLALHGLTASHLSFSTPSSAISPASLTVSTSLLSVVFGALRRRSIKPRSAISLCSFSHPLLHPPS
jgi:hypothetical protein